ncbi:MAG TPA: hypothetical protein VMU49_01730 [Candidatus Acidoferrales bacterium]|nr:hypothetical protein [Candidatus Acidoferrales bacterium]
MATTPPLTDPGDSPLPVGAMLERLVTIYGRRFGLLVIVGLIVNVPTLISGQLGSRWPSSIFSTTYPPQTYPPHLSLDSGMAIRFGLAGLIALLFLPWLIGAMPRAALAAVNGQATDVGGVLAAVLHRYFRLYGMFFVLGLVVSALAVTIIGIPVAIWIGVRWSLAPIVLFAEDLGAMQSLGRSWSLVRGSWWRTFGLILLVALITVLIELGSHLIPFGIFQYAVASLLAPFGAILLVIIYRERIWSQSQQGAAPKAPAP